MGDRLLIGALLLVGLGAGCGKRPPTQAEAVLGDSLSVDVARVRPAEAVQVRTGPTDSLALAPRLTVRVSDGQLLVTVGPAPAPPGDTLRVLWAEDSTGTLLGAWRPPTAGADSAARRPILRVIASPDLTGIRAHARYTHRGLWRSAPTDPR